MVKAKGAASRGAHKKKRRTEEEVKGNLSIYYHAHKERQKAKYNGSPPSYVELQIAEFLLFLHEATASEGTERIAGEQLRDALDGFYDTLREVPSDEARMSISIAAGKLFLNALEFTQLSVFANVIKTERDHSQAKKARDGKNPIIEQRRKLIETNYKLEDMSRPRKFAEAFSREINEAFRSEGLVRNEKDAISPRQIERYVKAILEERQKGPGHSKRTPKR